MPAHQLVAFSQTHDVTGNRMLGERLCHLLSYEAAKLAAGAVLLSPYIPLLFMGEEYAETSPFCYFIDHSDFRLIEAVREGRNNEFKDSLWDKEPPAPDDDSTFLASKLNWRLLNETQHRTLLEFYKALIQLRKTVEAFKVTKQGLECRQLHPNVLGVKRTYNDSVVLLLMNFNPYEVALQFPLAGTWHKRLDSSDSKWLGGGSAVPDEVNEMFDSTISQESLVVFQYMPW